MWFSAMQERVNRTNPATASRSDTSMDNAGVLQVTGVREPQRIQFGAKVPS